MSAVYRKTSYKIPYCSDAVEAGIDRFQGTRYGVNIRFRTTDKVIYASPIFANQEEENFITHSRLGIYRYQIEGRLHVIHQ